MKILTPDYSGVVEHAQELATKQTDADIIRGDVVDRVISLYEFLSRRPYWQSGGERYQDEEDIKSMITPEQLSKRELYAVIDGLPEIIEKSPGKSHIPLPFISGLIQASYDNGLNDFDIDLTPFLPRNHRWVDDINSLQGEKDRLLQVTLKVPCISGCMKGSRYLDLRVLGEAKNVAEYVQDSILYFPESYIGPLIKYNGVEVSPINAANAQNCTIYVSDEATRKITQSKTENCTVHVITDEIKKELEK